MPHIAPNSIPPSWYMTRTPRLNYDSLTLDGITDTEPYHVSGIDYDASTRSIIDQANSGNPFVTNGADLSGPNKVIRYDTVSKTVAYTADLAEFVAQARVGNSAAGGFQDSAEDAEGNAYVTTTFNVGAIAKISKTGDVTPWYIGDATPSFDVASESPAPTDITMTGRPADGSYAGLGCDGLISPARYGRKVLLCSDNGQAATTLWATGDGFASVRYVGQVANNGTEEVAKFGTVVATVEMGNSLYVNNEFFNDTGVFDLAGDRASFPLVGSTAEFDALVSAARFEITTC
ncbi:hypothetical protein INS49_002751 [Diaporthe citri]|uniref:uncharacterized protein n=1 Tax=Diaporthe citri TaxID=83186 RepID=UPI001C7F3485|nr:uncharacterized protein INS49_002751 [Diaporthe citri]KAG6368540.1 hypothetical protein INS49_002751 [Diaporthe citri]